MCQIGEIGSVDTYARAAQWRLQMESFYALLAICAENSPVTGEQRLVTRPVTRSFDVFFDRQLNKRLSIQSWGCCFETPPRPLWRHCNVWSGSFKEVINTFSVNLTSPNTFVHTRCAVLPKNVANVLMWHRYWNSYIHVSLKIYILSQYATYTYAFNITFIFLSNF